MGVSVWFFLRTRTFRGAQLTVRLGEGFSEVRLVARRIRRAMSRTPFEVKPFPRERRVVVDALEVGIHRHMVHALLEFDVTCGRQRIRDREASAGKRLSFTAFIVASLARAVDADKRLHAYR